MTEVNSTDLRSELRACERDIAKGTSSFFAMCRAFRTIQEKELWKGTHKSFPAYCRERWEMEASEVSRYIKAAEVMSDLSEFEKKPTNGGQCRVLGKLTPEQRQQVWGDVLKSEDKPTARLIEQEAKKAGFLTSSEKQNKEEAPPKEQSFVSDFATAVKALDYLADTAREADVNDAELVQQLIAQSRSALARIEESITVADLVSIAS